MAAGRVKQRRVSPGRKEGAETTGRGAARQSGSWRSRAFVEALPVWVHLCHVQYVLEQDGLRRHWEWTRNGVSRRREECHRGRSASDAPPTQALSECRSEARPCSPACSARTAGPSMGSIRLRCLQVSWSGWPATWVRAPLLAQTWGLQSWTSTRQPEQWHGISASGVWRVRLSPVHCASDASL